MSSLTVPQSPIRFKLDKHSPERDLKITDEYWDKKEGMTSPLEAGIKKSEEIDLNEDAT